jgi:hypothetical protein
MVIAHLSKALNEYKEINAAYLFGSFYEADTFSDIDIGILTQTPLGNPLPFELALSTKLEKDIQYRVDIRVINDAPISFVQNIIRTGKVLIDKDSNFRVDFEGIVLKKYFDFAPFRRRFLKEKEIADAADGK